jgi:hypothetical protein
MNKQRQDARDSAILIYNTLQINSPVKTAFNKSSGEASDLLKALTQKVEETSSIFKLSLKIWSYALPSVDNRISIISQLKENQEGHDEMIVFSHSQGNFYANIACDSMEKKFKNIQIASPTGSIHCGKKNYYTTLSSDEMYQLVSNLSRTSNREPASMLNSQNMLLNIFGETLSRYIAENIKTTPPMKWNVSQTSSLVNSKSTEDLFEKHSMNNYLSYLPSIEHIRSNYQEVLNSVQIDSVRIPLSSKTITCANIDQYLDSQLNTNGDFTINKVSYHPASFHTYSIIKEGLRYSVIEDSHFIYFGIMGIILLLCAPFLIKIFTIISASVITALNSDDEEAQ